MENKEKVAGPYQLEVAIVGVTPLLMHRFAFNADEKTTVRRSGTPDWSQEVYKALYKNEQDQIYQPAEHIERSIAEAGKQFKIPGKRGATYGKMLGAALEVQALTEPRDQIIHTHQEWVTDSRPVVVQKARVVRHRPRLDKWSLYFRIWVWDSQITSDTIKEILEYAGFYIGLGDYRPGRGGKYGKFRIDTFKEAAQSG